MDVRVIYWLSSTTLYLPPKTVEYDVVQNGSMVLTTATHTKQSNITTLDMYDYTDLIPVSQRGGMGPYLITTLDPVYGTTDDTRFPNFTMSVICTSQIFRIANDFEGPIQHLMAMS